MTALSPPTALRLRSTTVGELRSDSHDALRSSGCETPQLDADVLLSSAIGCDRATLIAEPQREVGPQTVSRAQAAISRRMHREPVAYILERCAFRWLELHIDRRALIPRPETELLVEVALELVDSGCVHDVGTGSGAVALAIKDERPQLTVTGSDSSADAVALARHNAWSLGLDVEFNVVSGLAQASFDLVVANLPYLASAEWPGLLPELRCYEPASALVAGADALEVIRAVIQSAAPGQLMALEHAPWQGQAVRDLLWSSHTRRDLAGHERVTIGRATGGQTTRAQV